MSDDPNQPTATEAERDRADARTAELKSELAATDARRAEEERAKAHEQVEQAQQQEEKLSRKEQRAREKAKAAEEEAERARRVAEESARAREQAERREPQVTVASSASAASSPPMSDRPEVMVGAAFAGAFVVARVLKRLFD